MNAAHKPHITSAVTCTAVDMLIKRDEVGMRKYGVSLDREDLTPADFCQHALEEALDMACYLIGLKREMEKQRQQLEEAQRAAREYALLRDGLNRVMRDMERPRRYNCEQSYQDGFKAYENALQDFLAGFDSAQILRQLRRS